MEERLDFIVLEKSRRGGVSFAVLASLIVHVLLAIYLIRNYRPVTDVERTTPMVRYIELIRQNPRQFVEAPGPKVNAAPLTAPYSDANRRASMPDPTGNKPTPRPGEGGFYTPPARSGDQGQRPEQAASQTGAAANAASSQSNAASGGTFAYHPPAQANAAHIDWRNAIREVGKVASLGTGQQGMDLGGGGEKGFAESGPISFETQWYDWGPYAESMVSRIRVNWYNNMPQLIQTGLKGVVTIRFMIRRDGTITDVTIIKSSGIPPYDFAARKAIELSSPLNPLPNDFPNPTEHVTAMFYYNQEPPVR